MTKKIYRFSVRLGGKDPKQAGVLFLLLHVLLWCALALALSLTASLLFSGTTQGNEITIFCMTGYAGFFPGFLGGALYLSNHEEEGLSQN